MQPDKAVSQAPNSPLLEWKISPFHSCACLTELGSRVAGWQQNQELLEECVLQCSERWDLRLGTEVVSNTMRA